MKFGKEFASQMVPEWHEAYMNYNQIKGILKELQRFKRQRNHSPGEHVRGLKRKMTLYRAFSGLTRRHSNLRSPPLGQQEQMDDQVILINSHVEEGNKYETKFLMTSEEGGEYELLFFRRLDDEFNKVNRFYSDKVDEMLNEAASLNKQMDALIALRVKVEVHNPHLHGHDGETPSPSAALAPPSSSVAVTAAASGKLQHMEAIQEVEMSSEVRSEETSSRGQDFELLDVEATPETATPPDHNMAPKPRVSNFKKSKPSSLDVLKRVKINLALETPRSTLKGMLRESNNKNLDFNQKELKKAEQQLKLAFIEFYQKIRLLKSYSFLNLLAFSKIMKKYDKIASRNASRSYMSMVDNSFLGSSDEVTRLLERVESTFIKHFSNGNRRKGINTLRPTAKRERHRITFFLGFFAGCAIALVVALVLIVRTRRILGTEEGTRYMENMFPLYSIFGFIVLHMLMYAANIFFWRRYRINYPFIFGFKQGTELGYREVFLLSTSLAVLALAAVLSNLDMEVDPNTKSYETFTELLPLFLVTVVFLVAFCPFNIIYRSSRFFLIRCAFHCIWAPLYKVTLPDFFLADQLTSQVQTLRGLEFYVCYYGGGDFTKRENTCGKSPVYNTFNFIIACIPYWMRFLQCVRRAIEEHDVMQAYNGLKYMSTIIAVVMRTAYDLNHGMGWKVMAGISSAVAAIVSTYWDIVLDWGLLQRHSKNRWLRDKLLVSKKNVYFVAMVINVILRFAWLQAILNFDVPFLHKRALIAIVASLEIIRRGIWNFFRLENEHLNNVGKYRAFKSVPLPFNYDEDDKDE